MRDYDGVVEWPFLFRQQEMGGFAVNFPYYDTSLTLLSVSMFLSYSLRQIDLQADL